MADSPPSPPGYGRGGAENGDPSRADLGSGRDRHDNEYIPRPLTRQQREEQQRRTEQALQTPIVGTTPEAQALEAVRQANLAEHNRLEALQKSLDDRARRQHQPSSSR